MSRVLIALAVFVVGYSVGFLLESEGIIILLTLVSLFVGIACIAGAWVYRTQEMLRSILLNVGLAAIYFGLFVWLGYDVANENIHRAVVPIPRP